MAAVSSSSKLKSDPLYTRLAAPRIALNSQNRKIFDQTVAASDSRIKELFEKYTSKSKAIQEQINALDGGQNEERIHLHRELLAREQKSYGKILTQLKDTAKALIAIENPSASDLEIASGVASRLDCVFDLNQPEIKNSYLTVVKKANIETAKTLTEMTGEKVQQNLPPIVPCQHLTELQKNGGFHFGDPQSKGYKILKEIISTQSGIKYYELSHNDKEKTSAVFPDSIPDLDTLISLIKSSNTIARSANQRLSQVNYNGTPIYIVSYEEGIRMTSVFPIFYFYEYDSGNEESISIIEESDKKYSSQELGEAAVRVIVDFSNETEKLEAEKSALEAEIEKQKTDIAQKIEEQKLVIKQEKPANGRDWNVAAMISSVKFQKARSIKFELEQRLRKIDSELSPLNEKQAAFIKDNPVHFCDDKYVYVDLAVSWQTDPNAPAYHSRISEETGIHHGVMVRISLTDPILQAPEIQSMIKKLKTLH